MGGRAFWMAGILGVIGAAAIAQPMERRANITGGGNPGEGRCDGGDERDRALNQMRNSRIEFRRTAIDDNPGRQDWVIGTFEAFRGNGRGRSDLYRFSCSVDFSSGRVRSADFQRMDRR